MRICIFSDIHGNGPAFRVAYEMIMSEKADINLFLGDLCGYYFDQKEIFFMLQTIPNLIAIKGNHDSFFLRIINKDEGLRQAYLKQYGNSMENLLCEDVKELIGWLSDLPDSYSCDSLSLVGYHGSPWSQLEGYIYPDSSLEKFSDYSASIFFLGHTHYPMVKTIKRKLIVNPGSLGQPRNGGWPSYAVINYPSRQVVFKEVLYNKAKLIRRIGDLDKKMKSKPTILISAVCGDIGCSAVRSLREATSKIVGCDINPYSPVFHLIDKFYKVPPASDVENYMNSLKKIIKNEEIGFYLPISEPEIKLLNLKREETEVLGVKLILNNRIIIDNFLDKLKTVQYMLSIGLRTPQTVLLQEYDGSFGFPLIVKPRTGYGSKKIWILEDPNDLDYLRLKDDGNLIVQEYIGSESEEYTTGVFSDGSNVSSITFRRRLGFGGLSTEAVLVDEPALENLSMRIAKATGLVGSINIQSRCVKNENVFVPFEINPRLSSTLLFRKKFGFDDAVWWLDVLLGRGYSYPKEYKSGRAIRYMSECYFDIEKLNDEY